MVRQNTSPSKFSSTLTYREVNNALSKDPALWASYAGVRLIKHSGNEYGIKGDPSVSVNFAKGKGHDFSGKHASGNLITLGASLSGEDTEDFADRIRESLGYPKWGERIDGRYSQQTKSPPRPTAKIVPLANQAEQETKEAKELSERIARAQSFGRSFPSIISGAARGFCPYWAHMELRAPSEPNDRYEALKHLDPNDWRAADSFNFAMKGDNPDFHPALIAMIRNHNTGEATGFQAVAINGKGEKALPRNGRRKKSIGVLKGAGVYVTGWDRVGDELAICEGWETALGVVTLGASHVCACLSASGVAGFPIVEGIKSLWVFPDGDQAGRNSAIQVKQRYEGAGLSVKIVTAPSDQDWGDPAA